MEVTLKPMPKLVNSSWFIVSSNKKTTNHKPQTTNKRHRRLGLTLVEVLIVISILGILASFTSFALIGHLKQARDTQRISDLAQIKRALQSAKNDCKSSAYYPALTPTTVTEANQFSDGATPTVNSLMGYLSHTNLKYITSIFKDPKNTGNYIYRYAFSATNSGVCPDTTSSTTTKGVTDFILRTALEDTNNPNLKTSYSKCSGKFSSITFSAPAPVDTLPTGSPDGKDDNSFYFECND
jgi:prepilin-type N-terminal cleavage/methylation domain-containing protein